MSSIGRITPNAAAPLAGRGAVAPFSRSHNQLEAVQMLKNMVSRSMRGGRLILALAVATLALTLMFAPERAAAQQTPASGAAVAAQEAGAIFSDERIRALAERRLRVEEIQSRIEEIQLLQQLETVDPAAARAYRARLQGGNAAALDPTLEFFEAYDKAQVDRGVVLPSFLAVRGAGDDLVAQVEYDGVVIFVRAGQALDDFTTVNAVSPSSIIVDIRGRKFRIPLTTGSEGGG
ncbi:MAG: hypothetical protein MPJ52_01445 [Alphaproteobacteria bacterium]|nr:hypothetical protein [Alphaproteobacteria bacterium]MDA7987092.1 hypothetical protein [Alphaproteobacteria bacterium]